MQEPFTYASLTVVLRQQPDLLTAAFNLVGHGAAYPENTWRRAVVEAVADIRGADIVEYYAVAWACYMRDDADDDEITAHVVRRFLNGHDVPAGKRGVVRAHRAITSLFFTDSVYSHNRRAFALDRRAFATLLRIAPTTGV